MFVLGADRSRGVNSSVGDRFLGEIITGEVTILGEIYGLGEILMGEMFVLGETKYFKGDVYGGETVRGGVSLACHRMD